jgi:transposase
MPAQKKKADEYQTLVVGGAYLVKGLMRRLRIVEAINEALPHQPAKGASYGELMQVLIANRLSFTPEPLVHMGAWAAEHGLDRVFGLDAASLDDDRLGAGLEGLAEHQVDIWTAVLKRAVKQCGLDLSELHDDTTSVYFEGAYEDASGQPLGGGERIPLMVEGYNKDGQRHKVQFVLSLVVAGRTPVWYRPWDGNQTDDAVYLADMTALRQTLLAPENAVLTLAPRAGRVRVGDRKLSNQATLVAFSRQKQRFLGAHPWTDTAKAVWLKTQAQLAAGQLKWQPSDYVSQNEMRKSAADRTHYQVCEVAHEIVDPETGVSYPVRWIFSHSSAKAALDLRQREKVLAAGEEALRRIAGLVGKYDYTQQAVIEQRLEQALRKGQARAYFSYTLTGSDKAGDWHLRWRRLPKAIQAEAAFDGVALLCTNVPAADWSAATVMSKYKQQVLAEQAIDFIKSPVQIRPMWLHQPKRLAGLTLIIMLAVLLAALLELQVRRWLAKQGQSLTGLRPGKRRTTMPTAEALLQAFADYTLVIVRRARGGEEIHLPQLRPLQQQIWKALQLPPIAELAASTPVSG